MIKDDNILFFSISNDEITPSRRYLIRDGEGGNKLEILFETSRQLHGEEFFINYYGFDGKVFKDGPFLIDDKNRSVTTIMGQALGVLGELRISIETIGNLLGNGIASPVNKTQRTIMMVIPGIDHMGELGTPSSPILNNVNVRDEVVSDKNITRELVVGQDTDLKGKTKIMDSRVRKETVEDLSVTETRKLYNSNHSGNFLEETNSGESINMNFKTKDGHILSELRLTEDGQLKTAMNYNPTNKNSLITKGFLESVIIKQASENKFKGPKGDTGNIGAQGVQGVTGLKGDQGIQGVRGQEGDQGPVGPKGEKGEGLLIKGTVENYHQLSAIPAIPGNIYIAKDTGLLWSPNSSGSWVELPIIRGPQGVKGQTGHVGSQGVRGPQGEIGPQGIQGIQGNQGPRGMQGEQSNIPGPQGPKGEQGLKGIQGVQGVEGYIGPRGPQGPIGPKGDIGFEGPRGKEGPTGPRGSGLSIRYVVQNEGELRAITTAVPGELAYVEAHGLVYIFDELTKTWKEIPIKIGPRGMKGTEGKQGPVGVKGMQGNIGAQGVQGIQGARGPRGDQGVEGPKGDQGDRGIQGNVGPKGDRGIKGEQGERGVQGTQGHHGVRGPRGDDGTGVAIKGANSLSYIYSLKGNPGDMWFITDVGSDYGHGVVSTGKGTGSQNWIKVGPIKGPEGAPGPKGPQGIQGAIGPKGDTGLKGDQGIVGQQGLQGPQGVKGDKGDQGNEGKEGKQGVQGNVGPAGPTGQQGVQGPQGDSAKLVKLKGIVNFVSDLDKLSGMDFLDSYLVKENEKVYFYYNVNNPGSIVGATWHELGSIQGPEGPVGKEGPQGPQGKLGPVGYPGPQGPIGPRGDVGVQGPEGMKGTQGVPGVQGLQGHVGPEGPKGPQGTKGIKGDKGEKGPKGDIGSRGVEGIQGAHGPRGLQGLKGDKGDQGVKGDTLRIVGTKTYSEILNLKNKEEGDIYITSTDEIKSQVYAGDGLQFLGGHFVNIGQIRGPQGPQGLVGKDSYVPGPQGPKGFQGDQGVPGPQGHQGSKGEKGDTGSQGPKGDQGIPGPQGNIGLTGHVGQTGAQGIQGVKGDEGPRGERGYKGEQGEGIHLKGEKSENDIYALTTAIPGDVWIISDKGADYGKGLLFIGQIHESGKDKWKKTDLQLKGPKGEKGDQGIAGQTGAQGSTGQTGSQGIQGPTGARGLQGPKGEKGERGFTGQTGLIGIQGGIGPQGPKGEKGDQGVRGPAGANGSKGADGKDGAQGARGFTGAPGFAGSKGEKGDVGPQGPIGLTGPRGYSGTAGPKGDPGLRGTKGDKGETGPKGTSGVNDWFAIPNKPKIVNTIKIGESTAQSSGNLVIDADALGLGYLKGVTKTDSLNDGSGSKLATAKAVNELYKRVLAIEKIIGKPTADDLKSGNYATRLRTAINTANSAKTQSSANKTDISHKISNNGRQHIAGELNVDSFKIKGVSIQVV